MNKEQFFLQSECFTDLTIEQRTELLRRFDQCIEILPSHKQPIFTFLQIYGAHILDKKAPFSNEIIEHNISESSKHGFIWGVSQKEHSRLTQKLEKLERETMSIAAKLNMDADYCPDFSHVKRILKNTPIKNKSDVKRMLRASDTFADQFVEYYSIFGGYGKGTQDDHTTTTKLGKMLNVLLGYEANYLEKDGAAVAMSKLYDRKRKEKSPLNQEE